MENVKKHFEEEAKKFDDIIWKIIPYYDEMLEALISAIPFPKSIPNYFKIAKSKIGYSFQSTYSYCKVDGFVKTIFYLFLDAFHYVLGVTEGARRATGVTPGRSRNPLF